MNIISLLIPKNDAVYILDTNTVKEGLEKMRDSGYTAIPVLTKEGVYVGTVSEGDFLWNIFDNVNSIKTMEEIIISDIIRHNFNPSVNIYISMDELLQRAVNQSFIPVTDDRGYFIGIVTRQKIILTLMKEQ